jgi:hypothetical protein
MWKFIAGVVLGWFVHLHYNEQVMDALKQGWMGLRGFVGQVQ